MRFKRIVALVLMFSICAVNTGCSMYSDDSYNMVEQQQFALNYFKALGKQEDTIISPFLAMVTIGELSGIVNESVGNKSLALINRKNDISELNIDCGRLLGELEIPDDCSESLECDCADNTDSNFDYSSNFLIQIEEDEKSDGFDSAYTSNLSNLYNAKINTYCDREQYNAVIETIGDFGDFSEWHPYEETNLSLLNKLTYHNKNIQDKENLTPCNIETKSNKTVNGIIDRDVISCAKSEKSLSCKVSYGDTSVSLVLIMPSDENMTIDEFIDNMTIDEFKGILYGYLYSPWSKDTDGYGFTCIFPEIIDYSIIKDNSTYDKMGLGELFSEELRLDDSQNGTKLHSVVQYTGIEIKAQSGVNSSTDYNKDKVMVFNRPFIYALVDDDSNYPLIMGRVDDI